MPSLLARTARAINTVAILSENIGIRSTMRAFVLSKFVDRPGVVNLKFCQCAFAFRAADRGLFTHYSTENYRIVDAAARPVEYIVDGGANIGVETRRFRHFHPRARIVAVEADLDNFRLLRRNCELDRNIDTVNAALWYRDEPLRLQRGPNTLAAKVMPTEVGTVAALTIPNLLEQFRFPRIDILKLDIEGAEESLFRDAGSWLEKVNVIIFECNPDESPTAVQGLFRCLSDVQFKVFVSGENLVCVRASTGWKMINTADYRT